MGLTMGIIGSIIPYNPLKRSLDRVDYGELSGLLYPITPLKGPLWGTIVVL